MTSAMEFRLSRYDVESTDLREQATDLRLSFRRVLIPMDGTETSDWVLDRAWALLNRPDLSVTLMNVVPCDPSRAGEVAYRLDARHEESCEALRETLRRCRYLPARTRAFLRFGNPVSEILQETSATAYDLLIMGSHCRVGLRRWISGNVAEQVLRYSPAPILVFHPMLAPDESISSAQ